MASICNISFDNVSWAQATLPIKKGGIGLRLPEDVCLPAYISSLSSCRALVQDVLIHFPELPLDSPYDVALQPWLDNGLTLPSNFSSQRLWDDISCQAKKDQLRCSLDQRQLACLETASQPHSGDWHSALPLPSTGSLLDNDTIRIGLSLRLGLRICEVHRCRCGGVVDEYGLHPLSCRRSAGRFPQHSVLNDIIKRSLDAVGFPSILEPVGLDRGDGRRPDGMTIFPFTVGQSFVWDATCSDNFSCSNLIKSASDPGSVARQAEECKVTKYRTLSDRFHFVPLAVETSGIIGPRGTSLLHRIGGLLAGQKDDQRESMWLFQRIALAIVRGNGFSIITAAGHRTAFDP